MIARGVRNVIYNYTDAQRKVRSATSNDAWGPSPALMHEIADLTDNVVAYAEIMPIIWKRLNDHGKNWRHVYKSLVLLDHLIKYGNERVGQQCKENIFAIQTLKDFQYVEDQKDQGYNVRERAKQLVALLKDDERLRNERRKAQEGRERYVRQAMGMDSNGSVTYGRAAATAMRRNSIESSDPYGGASNSSTNPYATTYRSTSYNDSLHTAPIRDFVQPTSQEEEQLQMQIALAESQREAEDQERRRRNDELKIKIALERSVNEASSEPNSSQLFDLNGNSQGLDPSLFYNHQTNTSYLPPPPPPTTTTSLNMGWNTTNTRPSNHLGFTTVTNDIWTSESNGRNATTTVSNDPWQDSTAATSKVNPWGGNASTTSNMDAGLSINMSDPWGLGTVKSQPAPQPPTNSNSVTSKTIENELSDFFGAGATITPSYTQPQQQPVSSNPWNTTSSPLNIGSMSPSNTNMSTIGFDGNILYPTLTNMNNSNPSSASPLSSSLSASRKTPESFLGDKFINLVNLDRLVTDPKSTNPFGSNVARTQNPFTSTSKPPTLDQLTTSNSAAFANDSTLPAPLIPSSYNNNSTTVPSFNANNPFV
ncbi:unnamed protein product [Rotaria socialis]|uniref:ENTH domain-containing protein n=1 Tax=Rotaria socialis TaxID=392032 RepID=A0A820FCA2_9BILA|nr:unnamed protein product [Rotaria socialis]CAF4259442.1 unnamed protein product [Rotaria socialis]